MRLPDTSAQLHAEHARIGPFRANYSFRLPKLVTTVGRSGLPGLVPYYSSAQSCEARTAGPVAAVGLGADGGIGGPSPQSQTVQG